MKTVECVPNISEGKDRDKINAIVAAAAGVSGVSILDVDPGEDTNRTVITFAGSPDEVLEAAYRLISQCAELIDMRTHRGAHPRMGACDVCPFVPLSGMSMEECVALAKKLGERVASRLHIPVYLYEHAATHPDRKNLSTVRKGEYEGLREKLRHPDWAPDFGSREMNEKSGATIIGARPFLIAYNVNLNTKSKRIATAVAKHIRESGEVIRDEQGAVVYDKNGEPKTKPGLLAHCRAVGWYIDSYKRAQVSINLTDFSVTGMHTVFDACESFASTRGVRVTGSELVGLVPRQALLDAGNHYLAKQAAYTAVSEKAKIECAVQSLGLSELGEFRVEEKVIEEKLLALAGGNRVTSLLSNMKISEFVEELSSDSVAPGGGSVSALAASLAAALSSMVCALTFSKPKLKEVHAVVTKLGSMAEALKQANLKRLDEDTQAFLEVIQAMRAVPKNLPENAPEVIQGKARVDEAYKRATLIPLHVCEDAVSALRVSSELAGIGLKTALSDVAVAGVMAKGALIGGAFNVKINLAEIQDQSFVSQTKAQLAKLETEGEALLAQTLASVNSRMK